MTDVIMPQLGETVTEGTIIRWFKNVGDPVAMDENLFEVSTDKIDSEVPSPVAGIVSEILAAEGDVVEVGQVLCRVGDPAEIAEDGPVPAEDAAAAAPGDPGVSPASEATEPQAEQGAASPAEPAVSPADEPAAPVSVLPPPPPPPVGAQRTAPPAGQPEMPPQAPPEAPAPVGGPVLSPVVRRLIAENNLDITGIVGSGTGGRITRSDVEQAIRASAAAGSAAAPAAPPAAPVATPAPPSPQGRASAAPSEPQPAEQAPAPPAPAAPAAPPAPRVGPGDQIVALNNIRKRTAEHMVMSKAASPHVLTAMEVDYERVEQVRRSLSEAWKAEEGFSLTYLPFIIRAVADALRDFGHLNASFGGDHLVVHDHLNLGVAVDIDFDGLLAPVIRGADGKRLRQIAREVVDLAARARTRQLTPDDLTGGTFTVTNAGSYGTMMQFPIINQPQVAILSTDGVKRKPVVVTDEFGNESIAIHSVGVLALAWDHRAFDGAYAAAFLNKVQEIIETRDWRSEVG